MKKLVKSVKSKKKTIEKEPNVSIYYSLKKMTVNGKGIEFPFFIILDKDNDLSLEVSHMHHVVKPVNKWYEAFEKGYMTMGFIKLR